MDLAWQYLWAAGYDLPPTTLPKPADKPLPSPKVKRRRKARDKRQKVEK